MTIEEIPLTADNQQFSITLADTTWQVRIIWRGSCWMMDLQDERGEALVSGLPLVTGGDLLAQYAWLQPGIKLIVVCDANDQDYPTQTDLGSNSHLMVITE